MKNPCKTFWQKRWLALDCYCPQIQSLADEAEHFCGRWYRNERLKTLLVLAGHSGCGKTHVVAAIHRFVSASSFQAFDGKDKRWTRVPSVSFVRWSEVADEIRAKNYSSVDDMNAADFLAIDDAGAEADPWKEVANVLCQVLSRREEKFTVVTTNIEPEAWPERFDLRIADRLLRNSKVVNLFGLESYAMVSK